MLKIRRVLFAIFLIAAIGCSSVFAAQAQTVSKLRPIELKDILGWKSINFSAASVDGTWFACRLAPAEGNSEVVFKQLKGDKEYKFPIGESPRGMADIAFSEDARWAAYTVYPDFKEAKNLRKDKKKITGKLVLLNLATGDNKVEFDKLKRFSFSAENPGWLAAHKLPSESQEKEKDKWSGSDLVLRELATGKEWNIGNVSEFAFDKKGNYLAWIVDALGMSGNGIQVRDMATGVVTSLDSDKASYKSLNWTEKGEALGALKGKEEKGFEDKFFSLVGFTGFPVKKMEMVSYDPKEDKTFPAGMTISGNRIPAFTDNLDAILFGIVEPKKKTDSKDEPKEASTEKAAEAKPEPKTPADELVEEDTPDLVIWHWLDKRLQSQQQVQENQDKNFSYLSVYRIKEKKFLRLADEELRDVQAAPKQRWAVGLDTREYELMGNLDGRRYEDVYVIDMMTGARKLALKKARWYFNISPEGSHLLYYDDGQYHTYEMASGRSFNITKDVPASFINTEDDHNVVNPPVPPVGWVKDGIGVLLSDNWDIWNVPVHGGKAVNLTLNGKKDRIRHQRFFRLDPEERGVDLAKPAYLTIYGEWTKKMGIVRIEKAKPAPQVLLWDDAGFGSLMKAKKAEVYLYTRDTYKDFPDYYVADALLQNGRRITEANPQQKDILWSPGSMLIDYTSKNGDKLQGALYLPANYEKSKSYPTIVYYYEKTSQGLNRYAQPTANGFNKSVYTSLGYAVLNPDITYQVNDPGLSSVACILPAVEAAVATGVVDKNRLGCHGHSWGGYQTSFLITQTEMFKAAVAGAPLTNMISMYSSIYWNTGSANQPIFESSQGRFTGGYWENLDAYARNSPVYYADKVKTPLIILHNDKDGAVDWNQGIEYYNTLRRLKKPVVMLEYPGENHGLAKAANQRDYTVRMREFFDHYLMGKPAPKWLTDGIPHLAQKDHIKERAKELRKSVEK